MATSVIAPDSPDTDKKKSIPFVLTVFDESDEVAVVPKNWLVHIDSHKNADCWWPPKGWAKKLPMAKLVVEKLEPGPTWEMYKCRMLFESMNYSEVRKLLKKSEDTSDLAGSASEGRSKKRKRRPNPRYVLSDDDNSDDVTDHVTAARPSNFKADFPMPKSKMPLPPAPSTPLPVKLDFDECESPPRSFRSPSPTLPSLAVRQIPPPLAPPRPPPTPTAAATLNQAQTSGSTMERQILKLLIEIRNEMKDLKKKLNQHIQVCQSGAGSTPVLEKLPEEITLPMSSMDELDFVEDMLAGNLDLQDILANHLGLSGGSTIVETTKNILCTLMTNQLAMQFNWKGKGEKRGFSNLKLADVLYKAVKKNHRTTNATKADVEKPAKSWLKYAHDRSGGRKAREDRRQKEEKEKMERKAEQKRKEERKQKRQANAESDTDSDE